ncbi:HTH-type transcriptional regulator NorG [compost metagenome]
MVLHCSSFSKNLAPGYRIGWAAPGRYTSEVARQKLTSTLSASIPAQLALASYLERGGFDKHLRKLRHALGTQRDVLAQAVGHFFPTGTKATRPMGGYFLWVELPESCDALTIHRQALELGVSCAPGPIFSSSRAFSNCIRLNYGHYWDARAEDGVAILGRLARRQCER